MRANLLASLGILVVLSGCGSSTDAGDNVPMGGHWQVTVNGTSPYESPSLTKQYLPGKLILLGSGFSIGGKGVSLIIPMANEGDTGRFETGIELQLMGVPNVGHCEQELGAGESKVIVDITHNSRELFVAKFEFKQVACLKSAGNISGSGVITKKRKPGD
ncbi:MAG: hypothetical protein IMF06_05555 [Proteobacteria bacterium]|nr:hypothetical protein [Pseudomonadota bacterium]